MRIALIGCGALARIFYLPVLKNLSRLPDILVDPGTKSTIELSESYGIKTTATAIEEIIEDIDAAIIASPNFLHHPQAKYLLENRKHVLLEKPIATTGNQVLELLATSQRANAVLQPAMMRRFWKINKAVKKLLEEGVLGTLKKISMQEGGVLNWPVQSTAIFDARQSLGGVFIDTGSHTLDLLNWWVNDEDFFLKYEDDNHGGVEADCSLVVKYNKANLEAEISLSRIRKMTNEFILTGDKGWIKLKPYGNLFETSNRSIDKYIYNIYTADELKQQTFEHLFTEQVQSWLMSAQSGTKPVIGIESVLPSIRMIEQAYQSRSQIVYEWE